MPARPEPINAIAYAQYHLRGGWKGVGGIALLTAIAAGAITGVTFGSTERFRYAESAKNLVYVFGGFQWLLLCLGGFARVAASVRQDVSSGIIESHRLSPTAPLSAAAGYVAGGAIQIVAAAAVVFFFGLALSVVGGMPLLGWTLINVMALAAAVMLWSLATLFSFGVTMGGLTPLLVALASSSFAFAGVVPAVAVLGVALIGRSMWAMTAQGTVPPIYAFAVLGDLMLTGIFVLAAARRYRSSSTDAFSIRLGLVLLVIWSALNVVGLVLPDFTSRTASADADLPVKIIAAVLSSTLVAFVPVCAVARYAMTPPEMYTPGQAPARPGLAWLWLIPCVALACAPSWAAAGNARLASFDWRCMGTAVVVAALLVQIGLLTAWEDLSGRSGRAVIFVWLILVNLLPILAQQIADPLHSIDSPETGRIGGISSAFALTLLWRDVPALAGIGIACQAGLTLIPLALFLARRRGADLRAAQLTTAPPAAK